MQRQQPHLTFIAFSVGFLDELDVIAWAVAHCRHLEAAVKENLKTI